MGTVLVDGFWRGTWAIAREGGRAVLTVDPFAVTGPESTLPAHYLLEATVTELYGDFRPGQAPASVLAVQFALVDQMGARPKAVLERSMARRVDLPRASADALVRGYGDALAAILTELSTDLQVVQK